MTLQPGARVGEPKADSKIKRRMSLARTSGRRLPAAPTTRTAPDAAQDSLSISRVQEGASSARVQWLRPTNTESVFRKIFHCQSDAIFILNEDDPPRIVDCNSAAIVMFGYPAEEVIGRSMDFLYVSETADCRVGGGLRCGRNTGKAPGPMERYMTRKDGSVFQAEQTTSVLSVADGSPAGSIVVLRDRTIHARFEQELCNRTYELERRLKELNCLYGLYQIGENPNKSVDDVLKDAMSLLTEAWHCRACARVVLEGKAYATDGFRETAWRVSTDFSVLGQPIGSLEVRCLERRLRHEDEVGTANEQYLVDAVAKWLGEYVSRRTTDQALMDANRNLLIKQQALEEKNVALRALMDQIEEEKSQLKSLIQGNIDRIVMPTLKALKSQPGSSENDLISLLESSLADIASTFVNRLDAQFSRLTPRELEICSMVKVGLTSKDIASALMIAEGTVRQQRKAIRKKLGISNESVNLTSFLRSM